MDRTNLGDNFCETNTNEFYERTNLTYSKRTCQLIKHFEHFPNCSMGEFIGINIRGNLELPCKPKNIMECNKARASVVMVGKLKFVNYKVRGIKTPWFY